MQDSQQKQIKELLKRGREIALKRVLNDIRLSELKLEEARQLGDRGLEMEAVTLREKALNDITYSVTPHVFTHLHNITPFLHTISIDTCPELCPEWNYQRKEGELCRCH